MPPNGNSPGSSTPLFPDLAQVSDLWKRQEFCHAPGLGLLGGVGWSRQDEGRGGGEAAALALGGYFLESHATLG